MTNFVRAASATEIGENESKAFLIGDTDILICHTREGFFAVENKCTHQLQALEGGKIRGCFIFCPLHGQRFNLKDGAAIGQLTDKPLKVFPVKVEGGEVYVQSAPA
jgi:nitrite reductase/ring-hydroxylating ferredoxin subunit